MFTTRTFPTNWTYEKICLTMNHVLRNFEPRSWRENGNYLESTVTDISNVIIFNLLDTLNDACWLFLRARELQLSNYPQGEQNFLFVEVTKRCKENIFLTLIIILHTTGLKSVFLCETSAVDISILAFWQCRMFAEARRRYSDARRTWRSTGKAMKWIN